MSSTNLGLAQANQVDKINITSPWWKCNLTSFSNFFFYPSPATTGEWTQGLCTEQYPKSVHPPIHVSLSIHLSIYWDRFSSTHKTAQAGLKCDPPASAVCTIIPSFFSTPGQSTFSLLSESVIYLPVPYLSIASYFILKIAEHSPLCSNIFHWALSLAFLFPEILERQKHQFSLFFISGPYKESLPCWTRLSFPH